MWVWIRKQELQKKLWALVHSSVLARFAALCNQTKSNSEVFAIRTARSANEVEKTYPGKRPQTVCVIEV